MRPSRLFSALAMLAALPVLAACGIGDLVDNKPPPPCPGGVIVRELARLTVFQPGEGRDITDVVYEARLPQIQVGCNYDDKGVEVNTAVTITAARGPANRDRTAGIRYFVAVLDSKDNILAKREFDSNLRFPPNVDRGAVTDELVQRIPLEKGASAAGHVIVVGFQLSRDQLAFNRQHGQTGLLGPVPPRPDAPIVDLGGIDQRPLHEQTDDPYGDRP